MAVWKLLDLGLARSEADGEATSFSGVVGTIDYISPEQLDKDSAGNVGSSADVYSLGCTLYYTVTGEPPYPGGDRGIKRGVISIPSRSAKRKSKKMRSAAVPASAMCFTECF